MRCGTPVPRRTFLDVGNLPRVMWDPGLRIAHCWLCDPGPASRVLARPGIARHKMWDPGPASHTPVCLKLAACDVGLWSPRRKSLGLGPSPASQVLARPGSAWPRPPCDVGLGSCVAQSWIGSLPRAMWDSDPRVSNCWVWDPRPRPRFLGRHGPARPSPPCDVGPWSRAAHS